MQVNQLLLGELLVNQGLIDRETLNQALKLQVGSQRRLGHILVRMGAITDDRLADILSQQLGQELINIEYEFKENVKKTLPRYLCKKYLTIPLYFKNGNILKVAMANPSDNIAIVDLENYTGKVIEPCLARYSEIEYQIAKKIPLSLKDFFSPKSNTLMLRALVSMLCVVTISLSLYFYDYVKQQKVGQIIKDHDELIMTNHDLRVRFKKEGKILLIGRPAYGENYIKVSFDNNAGFIKFLDLEKYSFSGEQYSWLNFVLSKSEF